MFGGKPRPVRNRLTAPSGRLRVRDNVVRLDLLRHLSPLGWQHINLTGDYLWTDLAVPSEALQPLR